jgi:hypothetical protein
MCTFIRHRIFVPVGLLLLAIGSVAPGSAQSRSGEESDQSHQRNNCRLAHQILVHGEPAHKRDWAIGYANNCGVLGGEALAAAIPLFRAVSATGGEMETLVQSAAFLVDQRIFLSALDLATDKTASPVSRIQAIRIAYHQLNPATFQSYEAFVSDSRETGIVHMPSSGSEAPGIGTPLPGDALDRTVSSMSGIAADNSTPQPVRRAATYLLGDIEWKRVRQRLCGTGISTGMLSPP